MYYGDNKNISQTQFTNMYKFLEMMYLICHHYIQVNYTHASYPVYHSVHDNFYWMQHFGDPDFSRHLALGLMWAKTGILLATTPVLPYDPRDYAIALNRIYNGLVQQYAIVLQQQNITLGEVVAGL